MAAINDGSNTRLEKAEKAAAKFMMSHLSKRYDLTQIFYPVTSYDAANTYATGQMVYWDDDNTTQELKVYEANEAIPINTPPSDPRWVETTKRDELVLMYLSDLTTWNFFSADGPVMNETIKDRRKEAKDWVIGVGKGEIIADLPASTLTEEDEGYNPDVRIGGKEYEENSW